jgi:aminoglycoside phosphotransferase family enzyme
VLGNGLHLANIEALICLKAKAYLEITERIANGSKEDTKQLRKHKGDVFRLAVMLTGNDVFKLPESVKVHLQAFVDVIAEELPDKAIFKEMGLNSISVENVLKQIIKSFELNN